MKAILIIDLNDDTDLTSEADVIIDSGDFHLETKAYLKPLPQKKSPVFNPNMVAVWEKEIQIIHEIEGYNNCLDEIIGGEE